ncbi:hypothetical protein L6164_020357 [Bauhinia variegata]|uniref:Uncharacterized protein n=1 Tax=Bauhinia variegata TaxID=167791 RepID=A0ACB9MWU6_BAUVA|nr:hypothetical protein L6164_020357 [Bauhinia variegata]
MPNDDLFDGQVSYILIAMGSAAVMVMMFHLIMICLSNPSITNQNPEQAQRLQLQHLVAVITPPETPRHYETSVARLIPAHKYEKKKEVISEDDTCSVCLGVFEEGDELRTLQECMHSYHVPCIDAWLYSHSSCPICRKLATPSPAVHPRVPDFGSGGGEANRHHDSRMSQNSP